MFMIYKCIYISDVLSYLVSPSYSRLLYQEWICYHSILVREDSLYIKSNLNVMGIMMRTLRFLNPTFDFLWISPVNT